jgi:hypothetical protein
VSTNYDLNFFLFLLKNRETKDEKSDLLVSVGALVLVSLKLFFQNLKMDIREHDHHWTGLLAQEYTCMIYLYNTQERCLLILTLPKFI